MVILSYFKMKMKNWDAKQMIIPSDRDTLLSAVTRWHSLKLGSGDSENWQNGH